MNPGDDVLSHRRTTLGHTGLDFCVRNGNWRLLARPYQTSDSDLSNCRNSIGAPLSSINATLTPS